MSTNFGKEKVIPKGITVALKVDFKESRILTVNEKLQSNCPAE